MNVITVDIDQLLLDPNNYRLHSHPRYVEVNEKDIANKLVQKRTRTMIEEENRTGIKDLIDSFKTNGFLKIDNILVRKYQFDHTKYVVIEGNRRTAALKALKDDYENGFDIGRLSPEVFEKIEVVLYEVNDEDYALLMGLRHVSGVKEWGEYEQSELIMNLKQKFGMEINEIADRLGMTKSAVKKRLNSFIAMEKYRENNTYGQYFSPNLSGIFYELVGKKDLRDWLGWDDDLNDFINKKNLLRFFSWISPRETDDGRLPPIIEKRDDLRVLNKFIHDEEALEIMEETGSLMEALEQSTYYTTEGFKTTIKTIKKNLEKITMNSIIDMDEETKKEVTNVIKAIDKLTNGIKKIIGIK
jgi:ParB-like chromosome segregation protein Spo0J